MIERAASGEQCFGGGYLPGFALEAVERNRRIAIELFVQSRIGALEKFQVVQTAGVAREEIGMRFVHAGASKHAA